MEAHKEFLHSFMIFLSTFMRKRKGVIGLAIILAFVIIAITAPYIAPYNPYEVGVGLPYEPPSSKHPLGTNDIGQDILSELLYGARISLFIGFIAGLASTLIATIIGILAGYYEGTISRALTGLTDIFLIVPAIPLILVLAAYIGPGIWNIILVITLLS